MTGRVEEILFPPYFQPKLLRTPLGCEKSTLNAIL